VGHQSQVPARFTSSSLTRLALSLGNCGVELNAVLSFGRMTGPGLVLSDPLAPTSDPLVPMSYPLAPTLVPGVSSLSDSELVSSSWQRNSDEKLSCL
jgi:hypothetical protein